jgi:hypothetical protein
MGKTIILDGRKELTAGGLTQGGVRLPGSVMAYGIYKEYRLHIRIS